MTVQTADRWYIPSRTLTSFFRITEDWFGSMLLPFRSRKAFHMISPILWHLDLLHKDIFTINKILVAVYTRRLKQFDLSRCYNTLFYQCVHFIINDSMLSSGQNWLPAWNLGLDRDWQSRSEVLFPKESFNLILKFLFTSTALHHHVISLTSKYLFRCFKFVLFLSIIPFLYLWKLVCSDVGNAERC